MASVVLSFGGKEVKTYEIDKPAIVVGRDPGADICIDNLGVSRSHCQFLQRGGVFLVQDMNSANGTYVNGKRVGEHNLDNSDQIVVGKYVLTFKGESAAAPAPPAGAAPAADRIVPDSLNTYMMDGDKIKERLEEMRRAEEAKASAPAAAPAQAAPAQAAPAQAAPEQPASAPAEPAAPPPPPPPAQAASERPERHTRIVMGSARKGPDPKTIKLYLYASLALNILLAAALFLYMLHIVGVTE